VRQSSSRYGERERIERSNPKPAWCYFAVPIRLAGRVGLALCHAVNAVVHHQVQHVDISAAGVDEMVPADGIAVAIAADRDHLEIRPRQLDARCEWKRGAMDAMKAEPITLAFPALFSFAHFRAIHMRRKRYI
jgi:hypothetical protein